MVSRLLKLEWWNWPEENLRTNIHLLCNSNIESCSLPMAVSPRCSIMVVSYNNYDNCTGPCLQSLLQDPSDMEIIVVDNNSDGHIRSSLEKLALKESRLRIVFNTSNRGYAGGNNDGVKVAASDIIILKRFSYHQKLKPLPHYFRSAYSL